MIDNTADTKTYKKGYFGVIEPRLEQCGGEAGEARVGTCDDDDDDDEREREREKTEERDVINLSFRKNGQLKNGKRKLGASGKPVSAVEVAASAQKRTSNAYVCVSVSKRARFTEMM
jgi:hypothetical protein